MKPIWKSSTVWINLIPLVVLLIELATKAYVIDPEVIVILTAIANIIRRFQAPKKIETLKLF